MENPRPGGEMRSKQGDTPTKSQLLPLGSAFGELLTKAYFWPGVMACLGLTLLWATLSNRSLKFPADIGYMTVQVPMYYAVVALMLTAGGAYAIYRMVGKQKAWWLMPAVILFTAVLTESPVMTGLQQFFGIFSPRGADNSIAGQFIYMLFRAALPEELLKAIPVAIGVFVGARMLGKLHAQHPGRQIAVLEPIDGLLIGAASGFGFAFSETLLGYVPRQMLNTPDVANQILVFLASKGIVLKVPAGMSMSQLVFELYRDYLAKLVGPGNAEALINQFIVRGQGRGLELMLPRLFGDVFGHAAYAGIFGYFIGLATMKPGNRVKTVLVGLAIASVLHALWNAAADSSLFMFGLAFAAFAMLAVCIIKARQISPERSQLIASQIIDRGPAAAPMPPAQPMMPRPMAPSQSASPQPMAQAAAAPAAAAAPKPAPGSITWDDDSNQRIVEIGSARIPAAVGARLWERQAPGATASRGDGVVGEVNANPNDPSVLGFKNLSQQTWEVTLADGTTRELASGRSIKLEAGMKIRIGDLVAVVR
jgi:RsiW-degrading membrane proteinase PrsW (M82 family)